MVGMENIWKYDEEEGGEGEGDLRQSKLLESLDLESAMWRGPVNKNLQKSTKFSKQMQVRENAQMTKKTVNNA